MHAKHLTSGSICILFGNDLHQAICFTKDHCAAVRTECVFCNHHIVTCSNCGFFRRTRPRNFRVAINCPRNSVVHHWVHHFAEHVLHSNNCFRICNVCKLRSIHNVAHCIHARFAGLAKSVNIDKSTIAHMHCCSCESKQVSKWFASNRDHYRINFKAFAFTKQHCGASASWFVTVYFYASSNVNVSLFETLFHNERQVWV